MTQQVRTGYRKHRKAAWGLALLVVAAIAAVTIPLASGAPTKTLKFVTQPPAAMQKTAPATSADISVAVYSGNQVQNSQGQTPSLTASGAGTIDNFTVSGPNYNNTTRAWTWNVTPRSDAPSGSYTFTATLGMLDPVTSNTFRVAQFVCSASSSCDNTSNLTTVGQGKLTIANSLATPVSLDFQTGLDPVPLGCNNDPNEPTHTWNRLYIDVNGNGVADSSDTYFPTVALNFNWGSQMLQVTYMVRNSDWVLTNAARGNNDIEFCAEARHQTADWNGDGGHPRPFDGKYGQSVWDASTGMYSGVLTTVSNPTKVKTNGSGSPAICGRGGFTDLSGVQWRTWTVCIPYDWDWKMG
jgi:hypothetical protein